jgi:hypothetical protein
MKLKYIKPITDIIIVNIDKSILMNHSEPEITSNIGSNENNTFDEDDNDFISTKSNLWDE